MSSKSESLTADDLRNKLYHSLRKKGLVDSLKSQLRNRLVSELRSAGLSQSFPAGYNAYNEDGSLIARAADSLVADHLRHSGCDYTLSVFLPESGTHEEKIFTSVDLLRLLNISHESVLYKKLVKYNAEGLDKRGFLWQLLCEVAKQHGHTKQESSMQTEKVSNVLVTTLEEEFQRLDEHYATPDAAKGTQAAIEERMLLYQRQVEERARTDTNLEMTRFKETELTRIRLEERDKYRKETDKIRKELDRTYQVKVDALVERERNSIERVQCQQSIVEKETFVQRQSILEEIEIVRKREAELRRQMELNLREKTFWEDKVKCQEDMIKKREDNVRRKEVEFEQRLRDETTTFKTELEAKHLNRNKDLEYREIRLKEDERRVKEDLSDINLVKDELRDKRSKVNSLETDVQHTTHDLHSVRNQNELLNEKIRDMVDYPTLKNENTALRRDLESTKSRLAENQRDLQIERQKREELLREMGDRLSKPTPDHMVVQTELERARGTMRHEQALHQHQLHQTESKITAQVDRNRELMRKYEEQSLQMKEMNSEIRDLRHQLTHTRSALDNEVYGKPDKFYTRGSRVQSRSPSVCDVNDGFDDFLGPLQHSPEPGRYGSTEPELFVNKDIVDDDNFIEAHTDASKTDDYSYSSDLIEDTKKRLRRLEREAENLQQNYNNFHFRLTSGPLPLSRTDAELANKRGNRTTSTSYKREKCGVNTYQNMRETNMAPHVVLSRSQDRPLSSTPNRQPHPMSYRPYTPPLQDGFDLPKMNMSPVNSNPEVGRTTAVRSNRPISMEDLEARPGSPSVVVVEASIIHPDRASPQGQEQSDQSERHLGTAWKTPTLGLDNEWKQKNGPSETGWTSLSVHQQHNPEPLTPTQKADQTALSPEDLRKQDEEEEIRQKEQDRKEEEERRQRKDEKARKDQEAWEREQRELEFLEKGTIVETTECEKMESGPAIDPVMQKYMDIVAAQKEKEKTDGNGIAKKTLTTWNKGRMFSEDKTPSVSEEISAANDKSEAGAVSVDDDFDW